MKRVVIAIPTSHTWFYIQSCLTCLRRYPPRAEDCETRIVVVDNSWEWSPTIRGITETGLADGIEIVNNPCANKFHATALDTVVRAYDFDYLMTMESDTCVLRPDWLQWYMNQLNKYPNWFAAGHWHHEQFINPSCTLYRGSVLRDMLAWCRQNPSNECRWGDNFEKVATTPFPEDVAWLQGPFAEKRGWPEGMVLRERATGQSKGPGWYEPGQALYAWARHYGDWGYQSLPTTTGWRRVGLPWQTIYHDGNAFYDRKYDLSELLGSAYAVHFWLGTGALNLIKHVTCATQDMFREHGLPREAEAWLAVVDPDVRSKTLDLIRTYGWYTDRNCFGNPVEERDRAAVAAVHECYARAGVHI